MQQNSLSIRQYLKMNSIQDGPIQQQQWNWCKSSPEVIDSALYTLHEVMYYVLILSLGPNQWTLSVMSHVYSFLFSNPENYVHNKISALGFVNSRKI